MASQGNSALRIGIQLILAVVIVGLGYYLYESIVGPWRAYEAQEFQTELTRARMDHIRTALIDYRDENDRYPASLDSLGQFVTSDSAYAARGLGEVFVVPGGGTFSPDSLPYSPRTGNPFVYEIVADDSAGVEIYYLQDPDNAEDYIGAQDPDPALRNAASWE